MQEALAHHGVQHRHQRLPEAVGFQERAGLPAQAELAPGQHLEHFVHGAEAAGQGDETVGQFEHPRLAGVHGIDDFQPRHALVRDLPVDQLLRDHADDFAASFEHRIGDDAHQADVAAAVDQRDAVAGHARAEVAGEGGIGGVVAGVGAAVDAESLHASIIARREPNGTQVCLWERLQPRATGVSGRLESSRLKPLPQWLSDQFALWIARLCTAIAASCTASDRLGCAWQMRARSSALPLNSIASTPSWTSSETLAPTRCMPRMVSVSASASTFTKPAGSAIATARPTAANGKLPAL